MAVRKSQKQMHHVLALELSGCDNYEHEEGMRVASADETARLARSDCVTLPGRCLLCRSVDLIEATHSLSCPTSLASRH